LSQKFLFHKARSRSNPYRVLTFMGVILVGLFLIRGYQRNEVKPLFEPTPTPTRTSNSFALEGQTHFKAGDLNASIGAYQQALEADPNNAGLWSELARVQTYSSNLLTTREESRARMNEALNSADQAVKLAPEDSSAHAVRAFVLDWLAGVTDDKTEQENNYVHAYQEGQQALLKDKNNVLGLVYLAEILNDEQKWDQAQQYIALAMERDQTLMDVWRVQANILESLGDYKGAIEAYDKAIALTPNLTFLYIRAGVLYRYLAMVATDKQLKQSQYEEALGYFAKAVDRNKTLKIEDPVPYTAIGKVYTQQGEFFVAALNMKKALQIDATKPDLYGQLGMVYFKARNYESSIAPLKCAVQGCDPVTSCEARDCDQNKEKPLTIKAIPLEAGDAATVVYYYTYGSVLAGLYTPVGPTKDYCTEALDVLAKVRAVKSDDRDVMSIVEASESICASFGIKR
jgi:tetratricopeptide (TPR) repeat protein